MWNKGENVVVIIFMIHAICTCNFIPNNIKGNSASEHQRTERTDRIEHPLIRQRGLLNRKPDNCNYHTPSDCNERLNESFKCYRDGINEFNFSEKDKQSSGCNFIKFIVDCCDQLLCKVPDRAESIQTYAMYVKAVFKEFNVNKCELLTSLSNNI